MEQNPKTGGNGNKQTIERIHGVPVPWKLSLLRQKLSQKAKLEPGFRFYTLYAHLQREDVLQAAWQLVRKNGGSAGTDGIGIAELEESGKSVAMLKEIREELKTGKYRAAPVKRVYIPKANGKQRPLGIPTVKDRIIQTALNLILEPIFESDFRDCSYGFRPHKSAHQALERINGNLKEGYTVVYDADLKGYFDSIPHDKLMKCLETRIKDGSVLELIRMWLRAVVVEDGKPLESRGKTGKGTPQGGVISPLLANIYLHWFDVKFHRKEGPACRMNAKLVRYADDFVVMSIRRSMQMEQWIESTLEGWLGLEINREKTRTVELREKGNSFDFLGYTFQMADSKYRCCGKFPLMRPSKKACKKERESIRNATSMKSNFVPIGTLIEEIDRQVKGWLNYFSLGYCGNVIRGMKQYVKYRMVKHLRSRSQRSYRFPKGEGYYDHLTKLGLECIRGS